MPANSTTSVSPTVFANLYCCPTSTLSRPDRAMPRSSRAATLVDKRLHPMQTVTETSSGRAPGRARPCRGFQGMKLISAPEAAALVRAGSTVVVSGSGGGHAVPEAVLAALEQRFLAGGQPRDLCLVHVVGIGDRVSSTGADRFAHEGMIKRSVTSALVDAPQLMAL